MENGDKYVMMIRHYENLLESIRTEYVENGNKYIMMVFHYEELLKRTHVEYAEKIEKLQKENKDLTEKLNLSDDMVSMLVDKLLEKEKEEKIAVSVLVDKLLEKEKEEKNVEKTEKIKNTIRFLPYNKNTHAEKCKEYTMYLTYLENRMNTCYLWRDYKQILFCDNKIKNIKITVPSYYNFYSKQFNIKYIEFYNEKNEICLPIKPPSILNLESMHYLEQNALFNYNVLKEKCLNIIKNPLQRLGNFDYSFNFNDSYILSKIKLYSEKTLTFCKCERHEHAHSVDLFFYTNNCSLKPLQNWTIVEQKEKENGFVTTIYFFKTHIPLI